MTEFRQQLWRCDRVWCESRCFGIGILGFFNAEETLSRRFANAEGFAEERRVFGAEFQLIAMHPDMRFCGYWVSSGVERFCDRT
jgi:hypothetical protein